LFGWVCLPSCKHLLHTPYTDFVGIFIEADLRFYPKPTVQLPGYY
jgi:hypothetical protein